MAEDMMDILKEAALHTFQTMLMVELTPQNDGGAEPVWEIFGLIGYTGDVCGNIALCITREGASEAVLRFSGEPAQGLDDISDCVGELVNMIAGNAKGRFSDNRVLLSLPEVIQGPCLALEFKLFRERKSQLFSSEIGPVKVIYAAK
jgi:CheY-specific phosphatase CheX